MYVVNADPFGGLYNSIYTNMEQTNNYFKWKQPNNNVNTHSLNQSSINISRWYWMVFGKVVLFGEKVIVDVIQFQSGTKDVVTMLDYYYKSSDEDQKEWDEEYSVHKHVARKLINGCNEWRLRKDLEKQVKLYGWY